jgi:hypothetical protein
MTLSEWARKWNVPPQAFAELAACSIVEPDPDALVGGKTEAYVQSAIRLEAPEKGVYLWRNNVGAGAVVDFKLLCDECRGKTKGRRMIRWGLANDSKKLNEVLKSADLIGVKPVRITPDMVGCIIGQFWSRECKREDWEFRGTPEELAQLEWATLINSLGGNARIVKAVGSL